MLRNSIVDIGKRLKATQEHLDTWMIDKNGRLFGLHRKDWMPKKYYPMYKSALNI